MTNTNFLNSKEMFSKIAGYDEIKAEAKQIVDIVTNMDQYTSRGAYCPRGWLFYGDPGMGKTQFIKAIAENINYDIVEISSSDAIKRKLSISEDIVHGFERAKQLGKAVILIDELDKIAGYAKYEYEVVENLQTQKILLYEIDKIKEFENIIIIATANKVKYLGEILTRTGRFDRHVCFSYPTAYDRGEIIKYFLKDSPLEEALTLDELVSMTAGRSCADIECIVNEAIISSVSKRQDKVALSDFNIAINRVIFKDIEKNNNVSKEQLKCVAYHEAGHALVCHMLQPNQIRNISIKSRGESAGSVGLNKEDSIVNSKTYFENIVCIGIAGMLSTKVMTGELYSGNISDLDNCIKILRKMACEGMLGYEYCKIMVYDNYDGRYSSEHLSQKGDKIVEALNYYSAKTEQILLENKDKLELIANTLLDKRELTGSQLVKLIQG